MPGETSSHPPLASDSPDAFRNVATPSADSTAAATITDASSEDSAATRACTACGQAFTPDEPEREVCPDCHDRRTAMWVVGLFLLFFCFVLLPLLIQLFGTPRPTRI